MAEVDKKVSTARYFTIREIAERWHCSQSSATRYLRMNKAEVPDFAVGCKKGKKLVAHRTVELLEFTRTKRLT